MKRCVCVGLLLTLGLWASCSSQRHHLTVKIYESPNQVVRLQAIPDANDGKGYSHPVFLSKETVARVLTGLRVEKNTSAIPLAFQRGGGQTQTMPAFTEAEVKFFAPLIAEGLARATPEELVTFFETADISSKQRVVTSGGVYMRGEEFHVLIGNHLVKENVWTDVEYYRPPARLRPLRPVDHEDEPSRLLFEPSRYMITPDDPGIGDLSLGTGLKLHVAVLYKDLPRDSTAGQDTGKASRRTSR